MVKGSEREREKEGCAIPRSEGEEFWEVRWTAEDAEAERKLDFENNNFQFQQRYPQQRGKQLTI